MAAPARAPLRLVGASARLVAPRFRHVGDAACGHAPVTAHAQLRLYAWVLARELKPHAPPTATGRLPLQPYESTAPTRHAAGYLATNAIVSLFTDERRPGSLARRVVLAVPAGPAER